MRQRAQQRFIGKKIVSNDVAESISQQQLIAGRFDHVGLCQLHTKLVLYAADKGLHGRNVLQSVVVD